jgi:hypothetical protein
LSNISVANDYTADLKEAIRQLLLMASEREQLETRIAKQKKRVAALYELVQTDEGSAALSGLVEGMTDACRVVFRAAEKPLSPAEVRDRVQALGLPPQANLLASVHTTIKRMKEAGELKEVNKALESGGVGTAYEWDANRMVSLSRLLNPNFIDFDPDSLPENLRAALYGNPVIPKTPAEAKARLASVARLIKDRK